MEDQQFAGRLPELYAAVVLVSLFGFSSTPGSGSPAAYALLGRRGAGSAVTTSVVRRLGGPALGVLVFLAALGLWQLWAGAADSFLVPTATRCAGGVGCLADVGLPGGGRAEHEAVRRWLCHRGDDRHRPRAPRRGVPRRQAHARPAARVPASGPCDRNRARAHPHPRARRRVAHRGHRLRPLLPDPRQHRRGCARHSTGSAGHGLDAARRPVERALRIYLPAALPSIMAGLRYAVSLGLVLVIVSEFVGERTASATT